MTLVLDAALRSWPFDPWIVAGLVAVGFFYLRGWQVYHRRDPDRWHAGRLAAFLGGLLTIFIALASPIEPFASLLLSVHMVQHLLLVMVVPPLLWLGTPFLPLVRGLPEPVRTYWAVPLLQLAWFRRAAGRLTHPVPALLVLVVTTWCWHVPAAYDLALKSPIWHYVQHLCFLVAGLVFWFPVVRPYPANPSWPLWLLLPYLVLADLANTVLSALLAFSDVVLYPHYAAVPRIGGGSALDDQAAAGVLMWVPGSLAYLLPLAVVGVKLLFGDSYRKQTPAAVPARVPLPLLKDPPTQRLDLLRVPVVGPFLRWRHSRLALQLPLLVLAVAVVIDGFIGPVVGPMNLAGVLPWIHWRGLLILCLLVAGNFFCTACPFTLPRTLARRWLPAGRDWPRVLRGKWLAVGFLVVFFTAYEAFAIWDSPVQTAAIVVGYFAAAFVVDAVFRGGAFCKYVCPIGQFNFVQSLVSPLQVGVRDAAVCKSCTTKDCVRGRDGIPGCELDLALPRKHGNMDCTFCLDCAHACPHGNIGLLGGAPGRDLADDPHRSGIGRFGQRPDVAALVLVLVFAAYVNAAGMVGPVQEWEVRLQRGLGLTSPVPLIVGVYFLALIALPVLLVGSAASVSRAWGRLPHGTLVVASRFAFALVPLGVAMWVAHYGYHLVTGYDTAWTVTQRFAADRGWSAFGEPEWIACCCRAVGDWLPKTQIVILELGLLQTLYIVYRVARDLTAGRRVARALAPWAVLSVLLFAAGVWIVLQPMQMRGAVLPGADAGEFDRAGRGDPGIARVARRLR